MKTTKTITVHHNKIFFLNSLQLLKLNLPFYQGKKDKNFISSDKFANNSHLAKSNNQTSLLRLKVLFAL